MKRTSIFTLTLLLICICPFANAKEPKEFTDEFFKMVQSGKVAEAYGQLFVGSQIPTQKPQAVDALKRQTASALPIYGNMLGVELIREEKIGESIFRLVYVLKSQIAPTVWEFYFYKPKSDWFLGNILFNDEFRSLHSIK
jgi:hypothetical protein